jgi:hypothetical protein
MARWIGRHHRADPEPQGQEVAQGDGAVRQHGVVQRAVDCAQDLAVG